LSKYDIDILHGHLHEGCATSLLATKLQNKQIPVIFDSHGTLVGEMVDTGFIRENSLQRPFWERVESWAELNADRIIANSPARQNDLLQRGVSEDKITTIPDCIDTEVFTPAEPDQNLASRFELDPSNPIIVYTGSLHDFQGIDDLLNATEQLTHNWPDLQLLLVGGGEIEKYEQQAASLNIKSDVTFAGSQPFDSMPQFINLGDIGVVPRKPHRENLPLKMLTYMSAALPTVVADVASVEEVISPNRDAVLYTAGDAGSLADSCRNLLSDSDYREAVGREAREKICREYSYEATGNKIRSEYMKLSE
jgi:glycosyltransferase involved in cell wall biosynthesis